MLCGVIFAYYAGIMLDTLNTVYAKFFNAGLVHSASINGSKHNSD